MWPYEPSGRCNDVNYLVRGLLIVGGIVGGSVGLALGINAMAYSEPLVSYRLDSMTEETAERVGQTAEEYEPANVVASLYGRAGDDWAAAVAYGRAASAAKSTAGVWMEAADRLDRYNAMYGNGGEHERTAIAEASEWMSAESRAWDRAAESAGDAGRWQAASEWAGNAADARARAANVVVDADIVDTERRVASMMDRLGAVDDPGMWSAVLAFDSDAAEADRRVAAMLDRLAEAELP